MLNSMWTLAIILSIETHKLIFSTNATKRRINPINNNSGAYLPMFLAMIWLLKVVPILVTCYAKIKFYKPGSLNLVFHLL